MRSRLTTDEIGLNLTYSKYLNMHIEEPIILHNTLEKYQYPHWVEHINSLPRYVNGDFPSYQIRDRFEELVALIASSLKNSGFLQKSYEIENAKNESDLNTIIIRQYTEESDLYKTANLILRECHLLQDDEASMDNNRYSRILAPWILQLNTCIRKLPHYDKNVFRGAKLSKEAISAYKEGDLFIWASFVSTSKIKENCLGGNVLFEISCNEHFLGLNDKGYPRDISLLSVFPEEEELLFPVSCAFRVNYKKKENDYELIKLSCIDSY